MSKPRPSAMSIIEVMLNDAVRNLSIYPWRPHRAFRDKPERLEDCYRRLHSLHAQSHYGNAEFLEELLDNYVSESIGAFGKLPATPVTLAFRTLVGTLLIQNKLAFAFPTLQKGNLSDDGYRVQLHERLSQLDPYLVHEACIREVFGQVACLLIVGILGDMPAAIFTCTEESNATSLTAPLYTFVPDIKDVAHKIIVTFLQDTDYQNDYPGTLTFPHTRTQLTTNVLAASSLSLEQARKNPERVTLPSDCKLSARELLQTYFANTPFIELFITDTPFSIPRKSYAEHTAIFAPSGHGKTQLLQNLITGFLNAPDPPAMFILDSQGDMLRKIERLALFEGPLKDRLVILDPEDPDPPALNFFQLGTRSGTFDAQQNELFNYLFTAIDSDLTAKQGTAVTYLLKLMRAIPDATIETLKDVMEEQAKGLDNSRYFDTIATLDRITQDFFRYQFFNKTMDGTRQQVARRLYTILGNPVFTKMFAAKENRFSALQAMQEKKIVLINTSQRFLGQEASAVFGRFIIAQCLAAAYERGVVPEEQLALLVVDEASEYFDAKTERILSQARKYGLGLLFATQYLEQMPPQVKAAVNGNTAIKLAGPVSYNDAMMLSREMYTTGDFIRSMRKTDSETQFACHVRGLTPAAIALTIPFGTLEKQPTMGEEARRIMRTANAVRYGGRSTAPSATSQDTDRLPPVAPPTPDDAEDFADRY